MIELRECTLLFHGEFEFPVTWKLVDLNIHESKSPVLIRTLLEDLLIKNCEGCVHITYSNAEYDIEVFSVLSFDEFTELQRNARIELIRKAYGQVNMNLFYALLEEYVIAELDPEDRSILEIIKGVLG